MLRPGCRHSHRILLGELADLAPTGAEAVPVGVLRRDAVIQVAVVSNATGIQPFLPSWSIAADGGCEASAREADQRPSHSRSPMGDLASDCSTARSAGNGSSQNLYLPLRYDCAMAPDTARYEKNLRDELDGSALYAALAAAEVDPVRRDLFLQLSQAEAGHAQVWREKLTAAGVDAERFTRRCVRVCWHASRSGLARASCCRPSPRQNSPTATSIPAKRTLPLFLPRSADTRP